jgi:DUF1365 family protein
MNKFIVVRTPLNKKDPSSVFMKPKARDNFYYGLTPAQHDFIKSIFSWHLDIDKNGNATLELTVLNEKQATLARMIF